MKILIYILKYIIHTITHVCCIYTIRTQIHESPLIMHMATDRQTGVSPSLFSKMLGAKPPSSPTLVASFPYLALITFFRLW